LEGQTLALRRQFAGPALFVLTVNFIFLLVWRDERVWAVMILAGMAVLVIDLVAIAWTGMWQGFCARHGSRATFGAIWRILLLPWAMYFFAFLAIEIPRGGPNVEEEGWVAIWFFLSLGFSAWFGIESRQRLLREMRVLATQQAEAASRGKQTGRNAA